MFSKEFKKKAFTLMEIIVVIVILAVLMAGLAFYGSSSINRTRIQTTETYLRVLASDMEAAFDDYGPYIRNALLEEDVQEAKVKAFCETISEGYLHTMLNTTTLEVFTNGFTVETTDVDPWGSPYVIYYVTLSESEGNFIAMSPGPDLMSNKEGYIQGRFADDIVLSAVMIQ